MFGTMTEPIRMSVWVDSDVKAALKSEAAARGVDMGDLINELVEAQLPDQVQHARKHRQAREKKKGNQ